MEFEENPTKKKLTNMKVVLNEYLAKTKTKIIFLTLLKRKNEKNKNKNLLRYTTEFQKKKIPEKL